MKYFKLFNITFSLLICALVIYLNIAYKYSDYWLQWKGYDSATTFLCEKIYLRHLIRQPLNTISNIFYLYFSLEMLRFAYKDYYQYHTELPNLLKANFQYSLLFSLAMCLIFFESSIFHASMLQVFLRFDMMGVFTCLLLPALYSIHKIVQASLYSNRPYYSLSASLLLVLGLIASVSICSLYLWDQASYYVMSIIATSMIALNTYYSRYYLLHHNTRLMYQALFLSAIAILFYELDYYYCDRYSWMQLHSLWHVCSAFSMYYFYLYMRSEQHLPHQ